MSIAGIICSRCGKAAPRTGPVQKYCGPCSEAADLQRKAAWHKRNGASRQAEASSAIAARGIEISRVEASSIINYRRDVDLLWQARIAVPFDWAASKNHLFTMTRAGHVALRSEGRSFRADLTAAIREAIHRPPAALVVNNKVWLDLMVQKPNHRGDAVNFVDLICDAVKDAIGVDDRWFSIRHLDWQVVKSDPKIIIGIGQEHDFHAQVCSSCGRTLRLSSFQKSVRNKHGVSRNCRECSSARRRRPVEPIILQTQEPL